MISCVSLGVSCADMGTKLKTPGGTPACKAGSQRVREAQRLDLTYLMECID
jgi:hypothetical protein